MEKSVSKETMRKGGYRKIEYACHQALLDGLEYAWVDTCCIDKSSSAELTEAINSMFTWYEEAEVYYAYLADVKVSEEAPNTSSGLEPRGEDDMDCGRDTPGSKDPDGGSSVSDSGISTAERAFDSGSVEADGHTQSPRTVIQREKALLAMIRKEAKERLVAEMHSSRWFTRGWTLQELLAPKKIIFYSREWDKIDSLQILAPTIAKISGVPLPLLRHERRITSYSAAQRMFWASHRATTRIEDEAYCLLGIFKVNMPLMYGERDRAFGRLQEEILRTTGDLSLLAWDQETATEDPLDPRWPYVLALSPAFFAHSGFICRSHRDKRPSVSMRPEGILLPSADVTNDYLIALDCHDERFPSYAIGLTAWRLATNEGQKEDIGKYLAATSERLCLYSSQVSGSGRTALVLLQATPMLQEELSCASQPFYVRLVQHRDHAAYVMRPFATLPEQDWSANENSLYHRASDESSKTCVLQLLIEPTRSGSSRSGAPLPTWKIELTLPSRYYRHLEAERFEMRCSTWRYGKKISHNRTPGERCAVCSQQIFGKKKELECDLVKTSSFPDISRGKNTSLIFRALEAGYQLRVEALEDAQAEVVLVTLEKLNPSGMERIRWWWESCALHIARASFFLRPSRLDRLTRQEHAILAPWRALRSWKKPLPCEQYKFLEAVKGKGPTHLLTSAKDVDTERRRCVSRRRHLQTAR